MREKFEEKIGPQNLPKEATYAERLLSGILRTCSDCIKLLDGEGRLVFISDGGVRLQGLDDASQAVGRIWLEDWAEPWRSKARDALARGHAGEKAEFQGLISLPRGDVWLDNIVSPFMGGDGDAPMLLVISRDITDQKKNERALRRSSERFRLASRATSDAVWDWDLRADTIAWGDGKQVLFGYPAATIPRASTWWKDRIHPDDRLRVLTSVDDALAASGEEWSAEYRFLSADGSYADVLDRGYLLHDGNGRAVRMIGAMLDLTEQHRVEARARALTDRLTGVLESTMDSVVVCDADWRITYMNQRARDQVAERRDPRGSMIWDHFPAFVGTGLAKALHETMQTGAATRTEEFITATDTWIEANACRSPEGVTLFFRDVTDKRRAERALEASEQRLSLALRAGRVVGWEFDSQTGFVERSANSTEVLGIGSGHSDEFRALIHPEDINLSRIVQADLDDSPEMTEFRFIRPDGKTIWLSSRAMEIQEPGQPLRIVGAAVDVTERKAVEHRLWLSANHDALTGLPNRSLLQVQLERALKETRTTGATVSLLLIDLDNFKDINDTIGHDAGDAVLRHAAECLRSVIPDDQIVARFGGDEFVILLRDPFTLENAADLADFALKALARPITYKDRLLTARASIGIAASPLHDRDPCELMKDADLALYDAKGKGRNRAIVYQPSMRTGMERRVTVARDMRAAIDARQIVPFYQPKVCLRTGAIKGFEALARWQHPRDGILTPAAFSSVFEDPELAVAIGERMVEQVATDIRSWLDAGLDCGRIAVNLSSAEFGQEDLADRLFEIIQSCGVLPERFAFEVTETVFLGNHSDVVTRTLARLHEAGIRIALDDFGTGYASLTHLKQFPVDEIKVDQSFVRGLEVRPDDVAIVSAVVGLGRNLGLDVVAEGIETRGQAMHLREMGCDYAQGYLFSKPVSSTRVHSLLRDWRSPLDVNLKLVG